MDNKVRIRVELEIAATKMISQYMVNNEEVEKEIEQGIKQAFENFDFTKEIEVSIQNAIKGAIESSTHYGTLRQAVQKKADIIIDTYITKEIDKLKLNLGE